jgi:hyperosmotically inducible periplasmic protein
MRSSMTIALLAALLLTITVAQGCRSMTGQSTGAYVDDSGITSQVKAKLAAEKASSLTRVGVKTVNRVVTLTGVVDSVHSKVMAEELARSVAGVQSVQNNLQISGTPAASPR